MNNENFQDFKKIVLQRLKKFPCSSGKFNAFMFNTFEDWKSMSKEMWFDLYETIRKEVPFGLYDFTYFANSFLGINMYKEFFLRSKYSKKQFSNLEFTISPKRHNQLKNKHHFSSKGIQEIIKIRKHLKKKGLILLDVEYKRFNPEHEEDCYIMKNINFDSEAEFKNWKEKIEFEMKKEN